MAWAPPLWNARREHSVRRRAEEYAGRAGMCLRLILAGALTCTLVQMTPVPAAVASDSGFPGTQAGGARSACGEPACAGSSTLQLAASEPEALLSATDGKRKKPADAAKKKAAKGESKQFSLALYTQAWDMITAGQLDAAERALKLAGARVPPDFQWLFDDAFAWIAFYRKDYAGARKGFEAVLEKNPGAYMSEKGLGFLAIEQKQFAEGLKHLKASFRTNPYQVLASYTVPAFRFISAKRYDQALEILGLGRWVYPQSADVAFLLAKAYVGLGNKERAARHAVAAAAYAPAYIHPEFESLNLDPALIADAYNSLGWGLLITKDYEAALQRFDQHFNHGGKDPNAHRGRGFALFQLERYQDAVKDLAAAAKHEPTELAPITDVVPIPDTKQKWKITYNATSTLGWVYLKINEPDKAEEAFRRALADYPSWVDAMTGLGYSILARGDNWGAAQQFQEALEKEGGYPDALRGLNLAGYAK